MDYASKVMAHAARADNRMYVRELIRMVRPLDGKTVLDFGCGSGDLMQAVLKASSPKELIGFDPNADLRKQARRKMRGVKSARVIPDLCTVEAGTVDVAFMTHVLGHVDTPMLALLRLGIRMKPGGLLGIINPNKTHTMLRRIPDFLRGKKDDPTLKHHFTYRDLSGMLEDTGFRVRQVAERGYSTLGVRSLHTVVAEKV